MPMRDKTAWPVRRVASLAQDPDVARSNRIVLSCGHWWRVGKRYRSISEACEQCHLINISPELRASIREAKVRARRDARIAKLPQWSVVRRYYAAETFSVSNLNNVDSVFSKTLYSDLTMNQAEYILHRIGTRWIGRSHDHVWMVVVQQPVCVPVGLITSYPPVDLKDGYHV